MFSYQLRRVWETIRRGHNSFPAGCKYTSVVSIFEASLKEVHFFNISSLLHFSALEKNQQQHLSAFMWFVSTFSL